ncbi:MAG: GNAT family N-acetyltransferase [Methanomassiliicoccales archaeon]|nr:GNAT family N-acetyltransferase [Methanomassiliicoccales archaeon]
MSRPEALVLDEPKALAPLVEEWERLRASLGATVFSSHLCTTEWLKSFSDRVKPSVLVVMGDEMEFIAPLATRKAKMKGIPVRVLGLVGTVLDTSEYYHLSILRKPGSADLTPLTRLMASEKWDVLQMRDLACDGIEVPLQEALASNWPTEVSKARPSPLIRLAEMGDPIERFEPDTRKMIRRVTRALETDDRLEFRHLTTSDDVRTAMRQYAEMHKARWADKGGSIFGDPAQASFLESLSSKLAESGIAWTVEALIDGVIASQQLCIEDGGRVLFYRTGMSDEFKSYSPGYLVMLQAMRIAAERGFRIFDMGPGADRYKYKLGGEDTFDCSIEARRGKVRIASRLMKIGRPASSV